MEKVENDRVKFRIEFENDSWILDLGDHRLGEPLFKDNDPEKENDTENSNYCQLF